ncbi:hypothetical protein DAI22_01g320700 [Oryza sativa Japonica Group]|nr:hypothetical protein DAI22_01g320700 [Oryza sativa Japonica Group]
MSLLPFHSLFSLDSPLSTSSASSSLPSSRLVPSQACPKPLDARGATPGYRAAVRPRQDGRWTPAPPLPHNKTDTYVEVLQDETVEGGQRTRGCPTTRPASSSLPTRPPSPAPKTTTTTERRRRPAARRRCWTRWCSSARRTWRTLRDRPLTCIFGSMNLVVYSNQSINLSDNLF